MDTDFKPLLIVNVPSGLTPSSSIASAPFCVCVGPHVHMCIEVCVCVVCVCCVCVCAKAVGEEVTEILHETKTAISLSHPKSKEMGSI